MSPYRLPAACGGNASQALGNTSRRAILPALERAHFDGISQCTPGATLARKPAAIEPMHVAFVTSRAHPTLTRDDLLAAAACTARGLRISPALWDGPEVPWASFDAVVLRSTWDYHRRSAEFNEWLTMLEDVGVPVWNPVPLLRWNANKRYLRDLARRGVATVPT